MRTLRKLFAIAMFNMILIGLYAQTLNDINGNVYKTIVIGKQTWMAENLKTTKYNDGTAIPLVSDYNKWSRLSTPAYCCYENNSSNKAVFGALYNWYCVNTGKLCPSGWHVPTNDEWTTLTSYLGGDSVAGGKLKDTCTTYWIKPNTAATNESGFAALPGGYRYSKGIFASMGISGYWWSSTESRTNTAWYRPLHYNSGKIDIYWGHLKQDGFSIRCMKD